MVWQFQWPRPMSLSSLSTANPLPKGHSSPSQALFGLAIAAVNDKTLNKESFAIVGDHWDTLDFGEIEKDLAARLTDDDIKAVLWCIDAGNRVKKLSLAHCVNITGAGLEPLRGSTIIEQIDLSLAGKHQNPALIEPWHPPARIVSLTIPFAPPISCELVLPILDSIIERGHLSSLKHLQFPMAWRTTKWYHEGREHSNPNLAFVYFLMRYNQMLMNRGIVSCFHCSRNLSSSGYELVGSSIGNETRRAWLLPKQDCKWTVETQNQTNLFLLSGRRLCGEIYKSRAYF